MNRAPLLSTGIALAIGVVIALIVACGGAKGAMRAPVSPAVDGGAAPMGKHNPQIEQLDAAITADFAKLDAGPRQPAPPSTCPEPCVSPMATVMKEQPKNDPECKPGQTTTCKDTCTLADSICESAKKICDISKELPGDAWATGKCADGETSCNTAHDKCCGCQ